nr:hypothetical protein [Tanacetum cinerariifolium]
MPERNEATWNTMISVLSRVGLYLDAFVLFGRMRHHVFEMSGFVIACLLTGTALSNFYTKYGFSDSARGLFDEMPEKNVVSWTSLMVGSYARNNVYEEAFCCFNLMRHVHEKVDPITLSALLSECGVMDDIIWGVVVHGLVHKLGLDLNLSLCNTLLGMYSEVGRVMEMAKLFKEMPDKDSISWNSLIAGYAKYGEYANALKVFLEMLQRHIRANHVTFTSALASFSGHEYFMYGKVTCYFH